MSGGAGGLAAAGAGMGAGTFGVEYASTLSERVQHAAHGGDMRAVLANRELMDAISAEAATRGLVIGTTEALTLGLTGLAAKAMRPLYAVPTGVVAQSAGGVAGEAGAQLASRGEIHDTASIAAEAVLGGVMGLPEVVGSLAVYGKTRLREQQQSDMENLLGAEEAVRQSKLRGRDEETFYQTLQEIVRGGDYKHLYIDADALQEHLPAFLDAAPQYAQEAQAALATGGAVQIAMEDWLFHIAPDTALPDALREVIRFEPDGMSFAEIEAHAESELAADMERGVIRDRDAEAALREQAEIEADVLARLNAAGMTTADANAQYALLVKSHYAQLSADLGVSPEEAFALFPLNIWGGDGQVTGGLNQPVTQGFHWEYGQRRGLFGMADVPVAEVTGQELGADEKSIRASVNEQLKAYADGGLVNRDTGWDLQVSSSDRKKLAKWYGANMPALQSHAALAELVGNAVLAESHQDVQHGNEDVIGVHRLYAPLAINGQIHRVKLTVRDYQSPRSGDKTRLRRLEAIEIEKAPMGISPIPEANPQATARPTSGLENAPMGTLPTTSENPIESAQPTSERLRISVAELLANSKREDGSDWDVSDNVLFQQAAEYSEGAMENSNIPPEEVQFAQTAEQYGGETAYEAAREAGQTELTYRQWVQVRTPAFKAWFGDWENDPDNASKVVNENTGEPLVVYHGSKGRIIHINRNRELSAEERKAYLSEKGAVWDEYKAQYEEVKKILPDDERYAALAEIDRAKRAGDTARAEALHAELTERHTRYLARTSSLVADRVAKEKIINEKYGQGLPDEEEVVEFKLENDAFDIARSGDVGAHFTPTRETAEKFASQLPGGKVLEVFLSIRDMRRTRDIYSRYQGLTEALDTFYSEGLVTDSQYESLIKRAKRADNKDMEDQRYWGELKDVTSFWEKLNGILQKKKNLGFVYHNEVEGGGVSYAVLRANQIKSATDNSGAFSADNDSILYQGGMPPVAELSGAEIDAALDADNVVAKVRDWFKANLQGKVVHREGVGNIRISGKSFNKLRQGVKSNLTKARLLPAIPDILQHGEYHGREALHKPRRDNIAAFHFFSATVNLQGQNIPVSVSVAEDVDGNLVYNLTENPERFLNKKTAQTDPRRIDRAKGGSEATQLTQGRSPRGSGSQGTDALEQSIDDSALNINLLNQQARGSYTPATATITLNPKADLSTFIHEFGHHALEVQIALANRLMQKETLSTGEQRLLDNADALLKDMGVTLEQWNGMTLEEKRPLHEKVARSFETYIMSGLAPNAELQGVFARMKAWLFRIYKSLRALDAPLSDDLRQVFDRMLASDEEIAQARQRNRIMPMYQNADEAGMTEEEFADYMRLGRAAADSAMDEMQTRIARDLKYIRRLKSRKLLELQRDAREMRAQAEMEARREK